MSRCVMCAGCYAPVMLWRSLGTLLMGLALTGAAEPASTSEPTAEPISETIPEPTCIFVPPLLHRVDTSLHGFDVSSPEPPVVVQVDAFRRNGMTCTRANCVMNSCGNTGTVRIDLAPSADEATPASELGYRLMLVRGELPPSLASMVGVTLADDGPLYLRPSFDEMPGLDITLAAIAVDAAGNESAPTEPFDVRFDGCTLAAVGDRCEDELDPDTDLSAVFEAQLHGVDSSTSESELPVSVGEGASCALGGGVQGGGAWAVAALFGGLFAARHWRRSSLAAGA
jgi:hypothetical protein